MTAQYEEEEADVYSDHELDKPEQTFAHDDTSSTHTTIGKGGDFIRITGKGFCGVLEKLPLLVKLIATIALFAVSLAVVAVILIYMLSQTIIAAQAVKRVTNKAADFKTLISAFQNERKIATAYIQNSAIDANASAIYYAMLPSVFNNTDSVVKTMNYLLTGYENVQLNNNTLYSTPLRTNTSLQVFTTLMNTLNNTRASVYDGSASASQLFPFYSNIIVQLQSILLLTVSSSGNSDMYTLVSSVQLSEAQQQVEQQGFSMLVFGRLRSADVKTMSEYIASRNTLLKATLDSSADDVYAVYQKNLDNDAQSTLKIYESTLTPPTVVGSPLIIGVSLSNWLDKTSKVYNATRITGDYISAEIIRKSNENESSATSQIIGFPIMIGVLFFLSSVFAVVMVLTIRAPWQRMNHMLNKVLNTFVPQRSLIAMGARDVFDVKNGLCKPIEGTMVTVKIREAEILRNKLSHSEFLEFGSRFIASYRPIVDSHKGWVQDFGEYGLVAVFNSFKEAKKASREIENNTVIFNKGSEQNISISLSVTLHHDQVLTGTMGDETIIKTVAVPSNRSTFDKLTNIASRLAIGPLVKLSVVRDKAPDRVARSIGKTRDGTELCEILPKEGFNSDNVKKFKSAVESYERSNYYEAEKEFRTYCSENNTDDTVAQFYMKNAQEMIEQYRQKSLKVHLSDITKDETLLNAFRKICETEHSTENIDSWFEIERYKHTEDEKERLQIAKEMRELFFKKGSLREVNISEGERKDVSEKIDKNKAPVDLFKDVQLKIESNCKDTIARFFAGERSVSNLRNTIYREPHIYIDDDLFIK